MDNPLVSVIMPTYDGNPIWIQEAVDSVLVQSFSDFELIIINDASSSHLEERLLQIA
jgi:O-antigen biosynthesis protein